MPLPTINPTKTAAWSKLQKHYKETQNQSLQDLFEGDAKRGEQFRICWDDFYVDFSKNHLACVFIGIINDIKKVLHHL
ncbi:MAG: glucose-6-phosphate isomerase, partial [Flavobacteriaceae bacterium]